VEKRFPRHLVLWISLVSAVGSLLWAAHFYFSTVASANPGSSADVAATADSHPEVNHVQPRVDPPPNPQNQVQAPQASVPAKKPAKKTYSTGMLVRPPPARGWPISPYEQDQASFPGCRLVEEERVTLPGGGQAVLRLLQVTGHKYPYIRVETEEDARGKEVAREEIVADHLMVALRPGIDPAALGAWLASQGAALRKSSFLGGPTLLRTEEVSLAALPKLLEKLEAQPDLFSVVETDGIQHPQKVPDDALYDQLYGMVKISAPESWDIRTDASSVIVAVIDTGVRYTHQDLKDNMWKNQGEMGTDSQGRNKETNGVDDDGNGISDDVFGYDAANEDGDPMDDDGHGSHCSGTIAGRGNNTLGVAGVAWVGKIMAVKFLDPWGTTSDAILSVNYARSKGAKVSSNSWGGGGYSALLEGAIREMNTAGCLFIASAGNSASDTDRRPQYPACYNVPNVISVAATDSSDALASFSNIGLTTVDLGAPGVFVLSSTSDSDTSYEEYSGTSMACPHVSGSFALLAAQYPAKTIAELISAVLGNTDPLPALTGKCVTGGRLNLRKAMDALASGGGGGGTPRPALNNSYANAWILDSSIISSTVEGSRINANGQRFWWIWTAPATGRLRVNTGKSSTGANTVLTAFTGDTLATLNPIGSNDNATSQVRWSSLELGVTKGMKLTFRVDGVRAGQKLALDGVLGTAPGPDNDAFGAATVLPAASFDIRRSNFNATAEAGEPAHAGRIANSSVWFIWTPSVSRSVTLSTFGSSIDTVLAVYTGNRVSQLTQVTENDNASLTQTHSLARFSAQAGTTYRIAIDTKNNRSGPYRLFCR
jgi:subtilisin family serine protease